MVVNSPFDFHMDQSEVKDDTFQKERPKTLSKFSLEMNGKKAQKLLNQELDPTNNTSKIDQINDSRIEKFLSKGISLGYDHMRVLKTLEKIDEHTSMSQFLEILIRSEDSFTQSEGSSCDHEALLQNVEKRNLVCIDAIDVALSFSHGTCLATKGIEICMNYFQDLGFTQSLVFVTFLNRFSEHESNFECLKFLDKQKQTLKLKGNTDRRWADFLRYASLQKAIFVSNAFCKQTSASLDEVFRKFYPDARIITYHFDGEIFEIDALATFQSFSCKRILFQCPYGKNCTYGNKCKYFHPERGSEPRLSVTDMLMKKAGIERKKLQKTIMENKGKIPTKEAAKIAFSFHPSENEKDVRNKEDISCKNAENIGRFHIRNLDKSLKPTENSRETKHEKKQKQAMRQRSCVNAPHEYNDSYFTWTAGINTGPQPFEISRGCSLDSLDQAQYPCYRNCANVFLSCSSLDSLPAISFAHSLSNIFNDIDCDLSVLDSYTDIAHSNDIAFPDNYGVNEVSYTVANTSSTSKARCATASVALSENLNSEIRNDLCPNSCKSSKKSFSFDSGISLCSHTVNPKENPFANNTVVYNNDSFQEDQYFKRGLKLNQIMEWDADNDTYSANNSDNWLAKTFLGQIHEADEDI